MEHVIKFSAILMALSFSSCNQFNVALNTTVNSDGSCSREVVFVADSAQLVSGGGNSCLYNVLESDAWTKSLSFRSDSTLGLWHLCFDEEHSVEYLKSDMSADQILAICRAERQFASVEDMAEASPLAIDGRQIKSKCSFEKRFRWFYTEYSFSETFESVSDWLNVPISNFLSDDEASYYFSGTPNIYQDVPGVLVVDELTTLAEKILAYEVANVLSVAIKFIEEHYDEIPNAPMPKDVFAQEAYSCIASNNYRSLSKKERNKLDVLSRYVGSNVYADFLASQPEYLRADSIFNRMKENLFAFNVDYVLSLPGNVVSIGSLGNGRMVDGKLHFQFDGVSFLQKDFKLCVASRERNYWAFAVSILIGLVAVGLFCYPYLRRR